MNHLRNQKYKKTNNYTIKNILKVKDVPLELQQDFKPIIISINDNDKFGEKTTIKE